MISLIITLAIVGVIVWAIHTYIPMPPAFKTAIYIIAVVCVVFYVLSAFGLLNRDIPVPQLR
jgi:hypothetical protein